MITLSACGGAARVASGLTVSALDSGSSGAGSGKTLDFHSACLHPGV